MASRQHPRPESSDHGCSRFAKIFEILIVIFVTFVCLW
jgi:hypothetical protein